MDYGDVVDAFHDASDYDDDYEEDTAEKDGLKDLSTASGKTPTHPNTTFRLSNQQVHQLAKRAIHTCTT